MLDRGGVLAAYSDGLLEPRDASGDQFGVDRITKVVGEHQLAGVEAVATEILNAVTAFSDDSGRDDLTLCVLGR